jgi:hypothetical protein
LTGLHHLNGNTSILNTLCFKFRWRNVCSFHNSRIACAESPGGCDLVWGDSLFDEPGFDAVGS